MKKTSKPFSELNVWKKARILRNLVFKTLEKFPPSEKYDLSQQLLRSSRSITANIAEGHGRYHYKENIQFCRIARGSLMETLDHLICAFDCDYITKDALESLEEDIEEIRRLLNGYIAYLKKLSKPLNT